MKEVATLIFRYLTNSDFFNIYKPSGTEAKGGGQAYIDFPVNAVSVKTWQRFLKGIPGLAATRKTSGPCWTFPIHSIGGNPALSDLLTIYQRRKQSISISSQRITSPRSKRITAWHPASGFPAPQDPSKRNQLPLNLAIFILRTTDNELWAGWFRDNLPYSDDIARQLLEGMLENSKGEGYAGCIDFKPRSLFIDERDMTSPFSGKLLSKPVSSTNSKTKKPSRPKRKSSQVKSITRKERSEEEIISNLLNEDEEVAATVTPAMKKQIIQLRDRNTKAVKNLKALYQGKCQITDSSLTFRKRNGELYCEAHHLMPLGQQGADSPYNIVIVSPLIHRMLHYADVSPINLAQIKADHTLEILVNGKPFVIKWHPKHAEMVRRQNTI